MFGFAGKQAVDGAIERIKEVAGGITPEKIDVFLKEHAPKFPILNDIKRGYDKMDDEEKAEFWKNVMIAGAKLAAKMA